MSEFVDLISSGSFEDFTSQKDASPRYPHISNEVEEGSLVHALGQVRWNIHEFTLRFVGVVPSESQFIPKKGALRKNSNCIDRRYTNILA